MTNSKNKTDKKTRHLKVVTSFSNKPKAHLSLSGRWLENAGFKIGMKVNVIVREGCLVIIPRSYEKQEKRDGGIKK